MQKNYKQSADIILHLQNLDEVLSASATASYRRRMLNEDIEEFIVEEAASFPRQSKINLTVYLPAADSDSANKIEMAVQRHFTYHQEKSLKQLKQTHKLGWRNLLIAFLFMSVIISLPELGSQLFPDNSLVLTIRESLIIFGWIALWRPAELLLYEWYPFKRDAELYGRLAESNVQVKTSE